MEYLALLYDEETEAAEPGSPEWDAVLVAYEAFDKLAGDRVTGGEALQPARTARTVRRDPAGAITVTDGPYAEVVEVLGGSTCSRLTVRRRRSSWPGPSRRRPTAAWNCARW